VQHFQFTDACNGTTGRLFPAVSGLFQEGEIRERRKSRRGLISQNASRQQPPFVSLLMHFLPDIVLFRGFQAVLRVQSAVFADVARCSQDECGRIGGLRGAVADFATRTQGEREHVGSFKNVADSSFATAHP